MARIHIPNSGKIEDLKEEIGKDGYENLHILSDFDRTLTYGSVGGVKTPSIISMLRDGNHLTEDYAEKAHALFNHYHPIETDPNIPLSERKKAMREWWITHNRLLIQSGLKKSDLEDIVKNGHVEFRKGVPEFLDFLLERNIPLVILSASGCGDAIQLYFQKIGKDTPNIHYVTNRFNWDKNGKAFSAKEPIIHSLNKDETVLKEIPDLYKIIKDRRNVILLGDSVGDLGMIEGFDYDHLIKVGFLNSEYNKFREDFRKHFDVVLEGDGDFDPVNQLIRDLE
jgi:cytosolic 5'-nucleotidase 3